MFSDAVDAERRKAEYQKRHARGETEEAQRDMARLALVRKEREEAAKKIEEEKKGTICSVKKLPNFNMLITITFA